MKRTTKPPTKPGWYWLEINDEQYVVEIRIARRSLCVPGDEEILEAWYGNDAFDTAYCLTDKGAQWSDEPIPPLE
ncbi:MAG: hypothetical protein KKB59_19925 [Spirochaetes bacterium]|nr:hypothetical protein [Spirochaetota bacterium]